MVAWGAERVRSMVLALADAYVESFKLYGVPSDKQAERDLRTVAQEIAAGTISAIRGELDLLAKRTNMPLTDAGGYLNREIDAAMNSALKEGVLRLRRQRIASLNSESPLQRGGGQPSKMAARRRLIRKGLTKGNSNGSTTRHGKWMGPSAPMNRCGTR